ncbi:MAG TPA: VOC family protein [Isosphaeraceae bacterium]|nr:VOC family protein [Isosphaeraceae bacterium]
MAFAHLTLATRDVRATSRFFEATLGWRSIDRHENILYPAAWLAIAPGQELHLLEVPDFTASAFEGEYGRHFAVLHAGDDIAALKDRLLHHGAELIAPDRPTPCERFFFRDPNGYLFEVIAADHAHSR